jgi:hypothetical protein
VARREGERLLEAWTPPEFVAAFDAIAKAAGITRSELIRRSLARTALRLGEDDRDRPDADR